MLFFDGKARGPASYLTVKNGVTGRRDQRKSRLRRVAMKAWRPYPAANDIANMAPRTISSICRPLPQRWNSRPSCINLR